jgi:Planctomycete cytochrome C
MMSRPIPVSSLSVLVTVLVVGGGVSGRAQEPGSPGYNTHIRPILSEHCFKCHGVDEKARKGKLRLDKRDDAVRAIPMRANSSKES